MIKLRLSVTPATNNLSSQVTTTTNSAPPTCSFCGRFGHDYDRCYQRVGFPPKSGRGGRGGRGSRSRGGASGGRGQQTQVSANAARVPHQQPANDATTSSTSRPANNDSSPTGFTTEQMQRLITLLESSSASEKLFGKEINLDCLWLLDSGASHHMTGMLDNLYDCSAVPPCPVSLPDGVQTTAVSKGSVRLSSGLVLRNVLYVPNLKCNLIAVGQLILDSHCFVTFTDRLCIV